MTSVHTARLAIAAWKLCTAAVYCLRLMVDREGRGQEGEEGGQAVTIAGVFAATPDLGRVTLAMARLYPHTLHPILRLPKDS